MARLMPLKRDMKSVLFLPLASAPYFHDKDKARNYLENLRWNGEPVCPHCGGFEKIYPIKSKSARPGLYKCGDCRQQFTVTVGTVFEKSKIPLNKC